MRYIYPLTILFAVATMMSCNKEIKQDDPVPSVVSLPTPVVVDEPIQTTIEYKTTWPNKAWTDHLVKELKASGLLKQRPNDMHEFCPGASCLEDQDEWAAFWVGLISALTKQESNNNPDTSYKESFKDGSGSYVVSRGLSQISIESSRGYACGFTSAQEIHDPLKNLSCTVKIFNKWVTRDVRIKGKVGSSWQGGARYWSVLRDNSKTEAIKSFTRQLTICK